MAIVDSVKRLLMLLVAFLALATVASPSTAAVKTLHCGGLQTAFDGPPGSLDITARNVSCAYARHWAYFLGPAGLEWQWLRGRNWSHTLLAWA